MRLAAFMFVFLCSAAAFGQFEAKKSYETKRLDGAPPRIDGFLSETVWNQIEWGGGDFIQISPDPRVSPSVQTKFKILYDAKNLYIALKNFDPDPGKIVRRMSRRDGFDGDYVEVNIDSYFDKRSAFSFISSVSGVKSDEFLSNNGNTRNVTWDPIWYLQTTIDEEGWVAEIQIPLSQLRFSDKDEQMWGLQITRRFFRNQERSAWQFIPPDSPGSVHLYGELGGLKGIKSQKQLEIQPYVVAKTETYQEEAGNPFATGKSSAFDYGLDAKVGITSDVTLDLTFNPDFGQVEADPSQVNLSAFQVYLQEQRPFFIEGKNVLNFPVVDFGNTNLFYSRRIGRAPQGSIETDKDADDGVSEYVKTDKNTSILGAAKLTGKNKKGLSWGVLESVTAREFGRIDSAGISSKRVVEPLTNYLVTAAQQEINQGKTVVSAMFTATNRKIDDVNLNWLRDDAYSGGLDVMHTWKDRTYYVNAKTAMSHVRGSREAITYTQESSERYFQRPDNDYADVDTMLTALTGTGGAVNHGKQSGKFVYDIGYAWMSPQLEVNDIGFMPQTSQMSEWVWMQYRVMNLTKLFRSQRYSASQSLGWDFDKRLTGVYYDANVNLQFRNFWSISSGMSMATRSVSNADLRGGPALRYPGNFGGGIWVSTDGRKKFQVGMGPNARWGMDKFYQHKGLDLQFNYRPTNSLSISLSPSLSSRQSAMQYVTTGTVSNENRYIVAEIDQTTARLSLRMTYIIKPNLSLQYWGQPFGTTGEYSKFKYVTDADAAEYTDRFVMIPNQSLSLDGDNVYSIDENVDGTVDVTFGNPDFNIGQFKSNMVLRWEYIPSSTVFLVWSQDMNGGFNQQSALINEFDFQDKAHNVFLMKLTHRFSL